MPVKLVCELAGITTKPASRWKAYKVLHIIYFVIVIDDAVILVTSFREREVIGSSPI